jgi:hypothetical protein
MIDAGDSAVLEAVGASVSNACAVLGASCSYVIGEYDGFGALGLPALVLTNSDNGRRLSYWLEDQLLAYVVLSYGDAEYEVDVPRPSIETTNGVPWFVDLLTVDLKAARRFGVVGAHYVAAPSSGAKLYG